MKNVVEMDSSGMNVLNATKMWLNGKCTFFCKMQFSTNWSIDSMQYQSKLYIGMLRKANY